MIDLKKYIADIQDFPKKGILFRDISPLLANGKAMKYAVSLFEKESLDADLIVGPDARGFIFGTPVSSNLEKPFVMIRKKGKLPGELISKDYELEYGFKTLEIQKNAIKPGDKVVIIDDLLATGGTTQAIVDLLEELQAKVLKIVVLIELVDLKGREKIKTPIVSFLKY